MKSSKDFTLPAERIFRFAEKFEYDENWRFESHEVNWTFGIVWASSLGRLIVLQDLTRVEFKRDCVRLFLWGFLRFKLCDITLRHLVSLSDYDPQPEHTLHKIVQFYLWPYLEAVPSFSHLDLLSDNLDLLTQTKKSFLNLTTNRSPLAASSLIASPRLQPKISLYCSQDLQCYIFSFNFSKSVR